MLGLGFFWGPRLPGRGHGFDGLKFGRMRIVTTHAPVVSLFAVPIACPSAVYAVSPVPVLGAVAFAAEKIRVLEINWLAVTKRQKIVAIIRAVAVQAPDSARRHG